MINTEQLGNWPIARIALFAGPLMGLLVVLVGATSGLSPAAAKTAGIATWVALWWIFEPIPIPATSLIPFAALPLAGVISHSQVAAAYGHWLILLLLGGFVLSRAMECCDLHRRLALGMVRVVGVRSPSRLLLGFMVACAVCSAWISNTATVLMLLPIVTALIRDQNGKPLVSDELERGLLLGIAYSASIGGMATPIGTPPNVVLMGVLSETTGQEVAFLDWMTFGVPAALVLLLIAWLFLRRTIHGSVLPAALTNWTVSPWSTAEKRVLAVFCLTALAWITRQQPFGGWSGFFEIPGAGDDTVALTAVVLLFVIPRGKTWSEGRLLDWQQAPAIPWGLLLLFGGGIALARGFGASGLSATIGETLSGLGGLPGWSVTLCICLSVTFLTEVTSNTATTTLLMPILVAAALAIGDPPLRWMVPAALSASCAFMLPVATAPNAIVFGTGRLPVRVMARRGITLNLIGAVVITAVCQTFL